MKYLCRFSRSSKRLPFDSNNPIGYLFAVTPEFIIVGYEFITIACTLGLGISMFWLTISTIKEIQRILHTMNQRAQANKIHSYKLWVLFSELINAQVAIKKLSKTK